MSEVLSKLAEQPAYSGDLAPEEAWALVRENPGVRLLDIRSQAEWELVGRIPGAIEIEYRTYPGWQLNRDFIALARQKTRGAEALLLLCRSRRALPGGGGNPGGERLQAGVQRPRGVRGGEGRQRPAPAGRLEGPGAALVPLMSRGVLCPPSLQAGGLSRRLFPTCR